MKLELGRRYFRRDGEVTGPLVSSTDHNATVFPFKDPSRGNSYIDDGHFFGDKSEDDWDLVAEYVEPSQQITCALPSCTSRIRELEDENSRLFHDARLKAEEADKLHEELAACMGRYEEASAENARLKAELEALRPKVTCVSSWQNVYPNEPSPRLYTCREDADYMSADHRIAVLRIDKFSDGRVEAHLESVGEKE